MRNPETFDEIDAFAEAGIRADPAAFALPANVVESMQRGGVKRDEIEKIVRPRDVAGDVLLSADETERVARLAHVISLAQRVFGSDQKAFLWLRTPSAQLDGKPPIDWLTRESGARFVEEMLIRIDHGIAA